jgi:hypothetical protein
MKFITKVDKIRRKTKTNIPKLVIIFSLIKANFLRNNGLSKKNLTLSKGNRMTKLGILVFVLRLNLTIYLGPTTFALILFCNFFKNE